MTIAGSVSVNLLVGIASALLVLLLISNRRFPAAMVIVALGMALGIAFGSLKGVQWSFGPGAVHFFLPGMNDIVTALVLLVIPQVPLTIGNAVIGTVDTAEKLFGAGEKTKKISNRKLALDMGVANILAGFVAGMPMCHGAGGLAAHYRFGARTGGSNIMIGLVFMLIAVLLGRAGIALLSSIPNAVLGTLLLFAGLELALLTRDIRQKRDLFITFLIAGIGIATTNMSIAFVAGIATDRLLEWADIEI